MGSLHRVEGPSGVSPQGLRATSLRAWDGGSPPLGPLHREEGPSNGLLYRVQNGEPRYQQVAIPSFSLKILQLSCNSHAQRRT